MPTHGRSFPSPALILSLLPYVLLVPGDLALYVNRTSSALDVTVVADTPGWVTVGLGSLMMDGATIFRGFIGLDGKVTFKTQAGCSFGL